MTTETKTCETCVYYEPRKEAQYGTVGKCHRNPPIDRDGNWPSVYNDDWCGEHKTAQNEKLTEKTHD